MMLSLQYIQYCRYTLLISLGPCACLALFECILFFPNAINSFTVDYHRLTRQHSKKDVRTGIYNENCTILVLISPLHFKLLYNPLRNLTFGRGQKVKWHYIKNSKNHFFSKLSHLMANMSKMAENHFFKILPFTVVQNVGNRFFKNQWKKHQNRQIIVLRKWNVSKVRTSLFIPFLIFWPL